MKIPKMLDEGWNYKQKINGYIYFKNQTNHIDIVISFVVIFSFVKCFTKS